MKFKALGVRGGGNRQHNGPSLHDRDFKEDRHWHRGNGGFKFSVPKAHEGPEKIDHWLNSYPRLEALQEYCRNLRARGLSFTSYSPRLAQQIAFQAKERKDHAHLIGSVFSDYQQAVFQALDQLQGGKTSLTPELGRSIIHACTFLRISHPILSEALPQFFQLVDNCSLSLKDAVDFCLDLSRNSNLIAVGASDTLLSLLGKQQLKLPAIEKDTQPLHVKFHYACALSGNPESEIGASLSQIGAVNQSDSIVYYAAILWTLANPKGTIPEYLEIAIRNKKTKHAPKGRVEDRFEKKIRASIAVACSPWSKTPTVHGGKDLPHVGFGPYHVDFFTQLDLLGRKKSFAVEINGVQHYCLSPFGFILNGADILKRKVLGASGTTYIGIPNQIIKASRDQKLIPQLITEMRNEIVMLLKHSPK